MTPKPPKGWVLLKIGEIISRGYNWYDDKKCVWKQETNPSDVWVGKEYTRELLPFARRLLAKRGKRFIAKEAKDECKSIIAFAQGVFKKLDNGTISDKAALIGLRMYLIPKEMA
jgi:hypothetical protein